MPLDQTMELIERLERTKAATLAHFELEVRCRRGFRFERFLMWLN